MNPLLGCRWRPRAIPLEPRLAVGAGAAAEALARWLLRGSDGRLAKLRGGAAPGLLVVESADGDLPWTQGIIYLGLLAEGSDLLAPSNLEPELPAEMLERAIARRCGPGRLALLLDPPVVLPVGNLLPIDRGRLQAWLESSRPRESPAEDASGGGA